MLNRISFKNYFFSKPLPTLVPYAFVPRLVYTSVDPWYLVLDNIPSTVIHRMDLSLGNAKSTILSEIDQSPACLYLDV